MKQLLSIILFLLPICTYAQEDDDPFTADSPGETTGVDILSKGDLQWETGMEWEYSRLGEKNENIWTVNTSMIRLGVSDAAELRLQASYLCTSEGGIHYSGIDDVSIGTKVNIFNGWKAVPAIAMLVNVFVPGSKNSHFMPENWGGQIGLLFENQITSRISLGYEGDLIWDDDRRPTAFYGLCLGYDINEHISIGVEEYNYNTSEGTDCWAEISASYYISPHMQIYLGTDINLAYPSHYNNLFLGLCWQLND